MRKLPPEDLVVVVCHKPRHRLRRRDLRVRVVVPQWRATPPQTWPNIGLEFWVYVTTVPLTLLDRECGRCLARPGARTLLVARRIPRSASLNADLDLLVLHSDDTPADDHQGDAPSGSPGSPVAMAASGLRSSCSHTGGVAGGH